MRKNYTAVAMGVIMGLLCSVSCPASDLSDYLDAAKNVFSSFIAGENSAAAASSAAASGTDAAAACASSAAASGTDAAAASASSAAASGTDAAAASASSAAASGADAAAGSAAAASGDDLSLGLITDDGQWYYFSGDDGSGGDQGTSGTGTVIPDAAASAGSDGLMSAACAQAYLDVLERCRERILLYDWQNTWSRYSFDDRAGAETELRPVALADVCGDSTPELIFAAARLHQYEYSWMATSADLYVYGFDGTKAVQLLRTDIDYLAGGGFRYVLFQRAGSRNLWLYSSCGDENWTVSFTEYVQSGQSLVVNEVWQENTWPDYDYGMMAEYLHNGAPLDQWSYETAKSGIIQSMETLLLYNWADDEQLCGKVLTMSPQSMTFRGALEKLSAYAGKPQQDPIEILKEVPDEFFFSSGAGAWECDLTLKDDGSFTGQYHDSDADVVYVCSFHGNFGDFRKIDENTYSMRLENLYYDRAAGEEWTDAGGLRYISSDAYGIYGGDLFYLYLPGHPTESLPEGFLSWAAMYMSGYSSTGGDTPYVLSIYGLYNSAGQEGFGTSIHDILQKAWNAGEEASYAAEGSGAGGQENPQALQNSQPVPVQNSQPAPVQNVQPAPVQNVQSAPQLLPFSSERYLTGADIAGFNADQLQTAINEIYARHGYIFRTPEILDYFRQYDWYLPSVADASQVYSSCSDVERANIEFLSAALG